MMSDNNSIDNEEIRKIRRGSGSNQPSLLNRPASFVDHGLMFQIYFYCVEGHPRRKEFLNHFKDDGPGPWRSRRRWMVKFCWTKSMTLAD